MSDTTIKELNTIIEALEKSENETPITIRYDRMFGQKSNRWWGENENDEKISTQKKHVICHLKCRTIIKSPSKCDTNNCLECYSTGKYNPSENVEKIGETETISTRGLIPPRNIEFKLCIMELLNIDDIKSKQKQIKKLDNNEFIKECKTLANDINIDTVLKYLKLGSEPNVD